MGFSFFGNSSKGTSGQELTWNMIENPEDVQDIWTRSEKSPQLIFKHSTRCGVSRMVLRQFEADWKEGEHIHFLDLLAHRDLSNDIASRTGVHHESPQVIILHQGTVVHQASHQSIDGQACKEIISSLI